MYTAQPEGFPPADGVVHAVAVGANPSAYAPAAYAAPAGGLAQQQQQQPTRRVDANAPPAEKRAAASQAFDMYDTDRSGTIDHNEFFQSLQYLGLGIAQVAETPPPAPSTRHSGCGSYEPVGRAVLCRQTAR
jgi:hypothetical protein